MGHPVINVEWKPTGHRPPRPQGISTNGIKLYGGLLSRPLSYAPIPGSPTSKNAALKHAWRKKQARMLASLPKPTFPDESLLPSSQRGQHAPSNASSSPPPEPDFMFSPSRRLEDICQEFNLTSEQHALMREELQDWYFFPSTERSTPKKEKAMHMEETGTEVPDLRRQDLLPLSSLPLRDHQSKEIHSESSRPHSAHQKAAEKVSRPSSQEKSRPQSSMRVRHHLVREDAAKFDKGTHSPSPKRSSSMHASRYSQSLEELVLQFKQSALENPELAITLQHLLAMPANLIPSLNEHISHELHEHQLCSQEGLEKVAQITSLLCADAKYMDIKDFTRLHDVIKSIVAKRGMETIGRLGSFFSRKADADFKQADHVSLGRLELSEILMWLHKLYVAAQEDFSPWMQKDFSDVLEDILLQCKARTEVHKYERTSGLLLTMAQYGEAFRDLRKATQGSIEIENEGDATPLQPENITSFDDLHELAKEYFDVAQELGDELKTAIGAQFWAMGPIKDPKRASEKIKIDYGGNPRRLLDVVRFSIICADLDMARRAIEMVRSHHHWEIVRVKSAFTRSACVGQTGGYRDVKVNARHKKSGFIVEIQLHILIFYMIKQEGGHRAYEWSRTFAVGGITSAEDILGEVSLELLTSMMEIAHTELEGAVNTRASRKEVKKRMTLFECARLARAADTINEQGWKLLEYVGESKPGSSVPLHECKITDEMLKRDVMLKVAKAPKFNIDSEHRRELLQKAIRIVEEDEKEWISTADKLFLAECKCAVALAEWGMDRWDVVIQNLEKAIQLFAGPDGCGLGQKHPAVARARMYLGSALVASGNPQNGLQYLHLAEKALMHWYGKLDHRTSDVFLEISTALKAEALQPQLSHAHRNEALLKSIVYLERCLHARSSCFGEADMRVGNVYLHMADAKETRGDRKGALVDFAKCMEIWETSGKIQKKYLHTEDEQEMYSKLLSIKKIHDAKNSSE